MIARPNDLIPSFGDAADDELVIIEPRKFEVSGSLKISCTQSAGIPYMFAAERGGDRYAVLFAGGVTGEDKPVKFIKIFDNPDGYMRDDNPEDAAAMFLILTRGISNQEDRQRLAAPLARIRQAALDLGADKQPIWLQGNNLGLYTGPA